MSRPPDCHKWRPLDSHLLHMLHKKIETFSVDVFKNESLTNYAVSTLEFLIFLSIFVFCHWGPKSPQILESHESVTFPFYPSNRTKRWISLQTFWKSLWMSLFQFPEMHTLSYRFICSVELLFWENHLVLPFGPIWVRNSPKILIFFICINLSVTSNRLTSQMKVLQKLYLQQDQEIFLK